MKKGMLTIALGLLIMGCSGEKKETPLSLKQQVTGKWKLREVNNGVEYYVTFHEDGRTTQIYQDSYGGGKERPASWSISGDTLYISEREEIYPMTFTEINDSIMILMRSDSVDVIFDRIKPESNTAPKN